MRPMSVNKKHEDNHAKDKDEPAAAPKPGHPQPKDQKDPMSTPPDSPLSPTEPPSHDPKHESKR
jgi:hypothetical protein